jgi:N-acetylmuramoyl-L-alanine amidase CwlA
VKEPSGDSDKWYFTIETQESLVWLVAKLMKDYGIGIDHVIRHYDVTGKCCPNPYVRNNKLRTSWTWGEFIEKVKKQVSGTTTDTMKKEENSSADMVVPDPRATVPDIKYYRVRKSWNDKSSQIGAFTVLDNAKLCVDANPGYSAFNEEGKN